MPQAFTDIVRACFRRSKLSMNHFKNIDHMKAFAIILVVFFHAMFLLDISYANIINICITVLLYRLHVPLFILIAGFLCHRQEIRIFYLKKVRRILIPFLFFSVLKIIMNNLPVFGNQNTDSLLKQLWDAFICGQLYWFCYCLLIMFLIAPLLWDRKTVQWILLAVLLAVNSVICGFEVELTDILQLGSVLQYSPYFILGMLIAGYVCPSSSETDGIHPSDTETNQTAGIIQRDHKKIGICTAFALCGIFITGYLRFFLDIGDRYYISDYIMGICVMYLLFLLTLLTVRQKITDRVFSFLGTYSLQIMFLDPFWRTVLYELFGRIIPAGMPLAILITLADLALSGLTCLILQRIPGVAFLAGLNRRNAN